jgi:hypothetical protein
VNQSTTHIAGPMVGYQPADIAVQRCALCGEILILTRPSRMAVPQGMNPALTQFAAQHLIRVTPGNPTQFVDLGRFEDMSVAIPDDFCLALVEMPK